MRKYNLSLFKTLSPVLIILVYTSESVFASSAEKCISLYRIESVQNYSTSVDTSSKQLSFNPKEMAELVMQTLSSQTAQAAGIEPLILEKIRTYAVQSLGLPGESAFSRQAGTEYFEKLNSSVNQNMQDAQDSQSRISENAQELRKSIKDLKKQKLGAKSKNKTSDLAQIKEIVDAFEGLRFEGRSLSLKINSLQPMQIQIRSEVDNLNNQLILNRRIHEYLVAFSNQLLEISSNTPRALASERAISLINLIAMSLQSAHSNLVLLGGFKNLLENSDVQVSNMASTARSLADLELNTLFMETGFGETQAKALLAQYDANQAPPAPSKPLNERMKNVIQAAKNTAGRAVDWAKTGTGVAVLSVAGFAGNHAIEVVQDHSMESRHPRVGSAIKMAEQAANYAGKHAIIKDAYYKNYASLSASDVEIMIARLDTPGIITRTFGVKSYDEQVKAQELTNEITIHYGAYIAGKEISSEKK